MINFLAGMSFGALIAFFFTCFGMAIERRLSRKDVDDDVD